MKIIFLGTGCDYATPEREPVSILLKGPINILLDCNPSILRQLAKTHMDPLDVDAVFVSHRHAGHSIGIAFLLWGNIVLGRKRKLLVLWPEDPVLNEFYDLCLKGLYPGEVAHRMMFEVKVQELKTTEFSRFNLASFFPQLNDEVRGNIIFQSAPLSHWEEEGPCTLGCRLEFKGLDTTIAYAIDTQPCENAIKLAQGATILIHDASFEQNAVKWARESRHSTSKEAAEVAKKSKANMLALLHLHATRYYRKNIKQLFIDEAKQIFDGNVIFPNDLDFVDLAAYSPGRPRYTQIPRK